MKKRTVLLTVLCIATILGGCGKKQVTPEDLDNMSEEELEETLENALEQATEDESAAAETTVEEDADTAAEENSEEETIEEIPEYVMPEVKPEVLNANLEDAIIQFNDVIIPVDINYKKFGNHVGALSDYFTGNSQELYEQALSWGLFAVEEPNLDQNVLSHQSNMIPITSSDVPLDAYGPLGVPLIRIKCFNDSEDPKTIKECPALFVPADDLWTQNEKKAYASQHAYFPQGINCIDGTWDYARIKEYLDAQGYQYVEQQFGSQFLVQVNLHDLVQAPTADDELYIDSNFVLYYDFWFDATTLSLTEMGVWTN